MIKFFENRFKIQKSKKAWRPACVLLFFLAILSQDAFGGREFPRGSSIRDSEIEETLRQLTYPLFRAAGLDPKRLHLYVIVDPDLNAAATTRYTILLNTGLLIRAKNAEEVIGVIAHETGHIAGGHVARREEMMRKSAKTAMASVLIGAVATALSGSAEPLIGMAMAGSQMAQDTLLYYSRGQESSADQAGVRFLDALKWPSSGLLSFMEVLQGQELLSDSLQDAYNRTHPLSQDRVAFLKSHVQSVESRNYSLPEHFHRAFERLRTKLEAFIYPPIKVFGLYSENDSSEMALLARAIAHFRDNDLDKALSLMTTLRQRSPQDAYYLDLQAQMHFEKGQLKEASALYEKALTYQPDDPLMNISYAHTLIERDQDSFLPKVENSLRRALKSESENPFIWKLFARLYGKQGKKGKTVLALAEESFALGRFKNALFQAKKSLSLLTDKTDRLRAEDISALSEKALNEIN